VIEPALGADGRVTVNMGLPGFDPVEVPFDAAGLLATRQGSWQLWPLTLPGMEQPAPVLVAVLSMGNPHAVQLVPDVDGAPVATQGPLIERHERFPRRVNAGFLQVLDRSHVRLRVYERGVGETLACGTGACASLVASVLNNKTGRKATVHLPGGDLSIEWSQTDNHVYMTGPAVEVFTGRLIRK